MDETTHEMTLREISEATGLSRGRLNELVATGKLPSRLELHHGRSRRLVQRADVERLLQARQEQAATQKGPGRRPRVPAPVAEGGPGVRIVSRPASGRKRTGGGYIGRSKKHDAPAPAPKPADAEGQPS